MAKLSTTELLDAFKEMTLIELSEFVKEFETTFDVKAAAPVAAAGPAGPAAAAEVVEEQDEFDVVLEGDGGKKIQVIKVVRELTGLGLKEAKDAVEAAPKAILEKVNKETAEKAKAKLEAEGAKVTLKSVPLHTCEGRPRVRGRPSAFPAGTRAAGMRLQATHWPRRKTSSSSPWAINAMYVYALSANVFRPIRPSSRNAGNASSTSRIAERSGVGCTEV